MWEGFKRCDVFEVFLFFVWTLKVISVVFLWLQNSPAVAFCLFYGVCMDIIFFSVRNDGKFGKFGKVVDGVEASDFIHIHSKDYT